jgi:hypothetical protein
VSLLAYYRVLPALIEDVPTLHGRGNRAKTYVIDVSTSRTPEEGAHSPSWPNGLVILLLKGGLRC